MAEFGTFSAKDEALAVALAGGATVAGAAKTLKVSVRTIRRRLADPAFQRLVRSLRKEAVDSAVSTLSGSMLVAAAVLRQLLVSGDLNIRLRAATKILELGLRADEASRLEAEIEELRSQIEGREEES